MIDIDNIRQDPDLYRRAIAAKQIPLDLERLLQIDEQRRAIKSEVDGLRHKRNLISEAVAANSPDRDKLIADARLFAKELSDRETRLKEIESAFRELTALVPGLPCQGVPEGVGDQDNLELRRWGNPRKRNFSEKDHIELAALHGMVDFDGARQIAGSRAYALIGNGALLEMAVLRFALDRIVAKGFLPVSPPLLVKHAAMFGTGYFPLGEENAYELERDQLFMTGTSEVGIVSLQSNRTFELAQLPRRYVGISTCFRREAGAAGRDTKGLYRVHQFQKVEQIVFCANDPVVSEKEHFALLQNSEEIVQALELPYRVVAMCTGELGLGQVRKHDIETWMPSRENYGETHSCSSFHDFQARRLGIHYIESNGDKSFLHTLNNTAIATPRILIALLENHQNEDGSVNIPPGLRPYLFGQEILRPQNF
jgi:seryl-tRNA synthetase